MNFFDDLKIFFGSSSSSLKSVLDIQDGTAIQQTIVSIKKNIDMKGANLWILFCSAVIASVGLDQNSGAVIIGAMLISPLMGPILGVGMSVGINDRTALFKSIRYLALATGVSLLASYLYFVITPLGKMTPALLARTSPNSLDTIIAFAGGIAGIVAGSRRDQTNAIPGVAIATALMPPVCTAGFGLATGNLNVFAGAFYLFFLNAVFISLATYLIVRFLKFPYIEQVDQITQKRIKRGFLVFVIVVMGPSFYTLYNLVQAERLESKIDLFIDVEIKEKMSHLFYEGHTVETRNDSTIVKIGLLGNKEVEQDVVDLLNGLLTVNYDVNNANLEIIQNNKSKFEKEILDKIEKQSNFVLEDAYKRNQSDLNTYKSMTFHLEQELSKYRDDSIPISTLRKELSINHPEVKSISYGELIQDKDTVLTFFIKLDEELANGFAEEEVRKIEAWLKVRLDKDTITVIGK